MTKNSSGDEIANVNFLYDDIVHELQNIIDSCINSATDRRGYVSEHRFTKFSEITQRNGVVILYSVVCALFSFYMYRPSFYALWLPDINKD